MRLPRFRKSPIVFFLACQIAICSPVCAETSVPPIAPLTNNSHQPQYRLAAEFDPIQAVLVTWSPWGPAYYEYIHHIIREAATVTQVYVLVNDAALERQALDVMKNDPVTNSHLNRIHFIQTKTNTDWLRNYGPFGALDENGKVVLLDAHAARFWRQDEDKAPQAISDALKIPRVEMPLIQDGGNTMTDGRGTFFFTQMTYVWNGNASYLAKGIKMKWGLENGSSVLPIAEIHDIITRYTGDTNHVVLPYQASPWDGTGHINMFAKIITPKKILMSRSMDQNWNHEILKQAKQILVNARNISGESFEIIDIPVATNEDMDDLQYANSLMINGLYGKKVLVPIYNVPNDAVALNIYRTHLPDYEVVGIDSKAMVKHFGTINCKTETIPMPRVSH